MSQVFLGLPTYNGATHLRDTVRSLQAQSFADWTLLIADNGSTDDTAAIAQELASGDPRIRVHRHERNRGAWANFVFVLEQADAPLFSWVPDDYSYDPAYLEQAVRALEDDPAVALATCNNVYVDDTGCAVLLDCEATKVLRYGDRGRPLVYSILLAREMPIHIYGVFRTPVLRQAMAQFRGAARLPVEFDVRVLLWVLSRHACAVDPEPRRTLSFENRSYERSLTYNYLSFGVGLGGGSWLRMLQALPMRYRLPGAAILGMRWTVSAWYKTLYYLVHRRAGGLRHKLSGLATKEQRDVVHTDERTRSDL